MVAIRKRHSVAAFGSDDSGKNVDLPAFIAEGPPSGNRRNTSFGSAGSRGGKYSRSSSFSRGGTLLCLGLISFIFGIYVTLSFRNKSIELSAELEETKKRASVMNGMVRDFESKLEQKTHKITGGYDDEKFQRRIAKIEENVQTLQARIKKESHREIIERFGPGPHVVKFTVRITPDTPLKAFTVLMAPIETMPHSVHLFLEQVSHQLWDGCIFQINAKHILQTATFGVDGDNKINHIGRFADKELESVAFQEYSDDFPHKQYTLGFAGRPGGPDFYMNKIDNSEIHGPWGQMQHDLEEEADPCFGIVNAGADVVDELFRLPVDEGYVIKQPSVIVSVRIQPA